MAFDRIGVIGAGAWGTALAETLTLAGRQVVLWARRLEVADAIRATRMNHAYLPGARLDERIEVTTDLAALAGADALLLVVPAQHLRTTAVALAPHVAPATPVVICAKGLEQATGKTLATVLGEAMPAATAAVLSGPGFAADVVRGLPAAVTLASADAGLGEALAVALGYRHFRIYWTSDVTGVEIGGAVKNVLAIAAGIVDGRALGASAHAGLVTRGFAELSRFGRAHGARAETLMGLSGLGDLMLTCGSAQSRNMSLGRALGQGRVLAEVLGTRRSVSEGVYTAGAVAKVARERGIEMPIAAAVAAIVAGQLGVDEAITALLSRPFRAEA